MTKTNTLIDQFNIYIAQTNTNINVRISKLNDVNYLFEYHNMKTGQKWTVVQDAPNKYFPEERKVNIGYNYPLIREYHANSYKRDLPNFEQSIVKFYTPENAPQKLKDGAFTLDHVTD